MEGKNIWYLENIDVETLFCENKLGGIEHEPKVFKKGEYIYFADQSSDKVYFITSGNIKVGSTSEDGKEVTKAMLGKGKVFGELSLIGEETRREYAVAMEDTQVCVLTTEQMKTMMKDRSDLSLFFMKLLGSKVLEMERRLESLVFKDSRTRILEYLVELVNTQGQKVGYEWVIRTQLTHLEIANICATSRQTVTTLLNELRNKNLIAFDRRRVLIRDLEKLKAEIIQQS